jgi:ABC-type transporter Mla subunit MlaD
MENMIDWALQILKFVSIGLAGVFGVIALLVQYKDKDGKTTI